MAFVQVISGTANFTGSSLNQLIASNNRANSIVFFSARINGGSGNAWDTMISCTRPDDTHLLFTRAGNTGTVTVRWLILEDTDLTVEDVSSSALGAGANNLNFSAVDLAKAFLNPLGMSSQGDRDDDTGVRLTFNSTTQANAFITAAPSGELLSVQVVQWNGASVQEITQASAADASVPIGMVNEGRTFVVSTCTNNTDPWRNDEVDTVDLEDSTHVRFRRFRQTGSTNSRAAHVVSLPANMTVQRGFADHASGTATHTFAIPIAPVDLTKSVVHVCGDVNGRTQADNESGRDMNRSAWEVRFDSDSQIGMQRSTTNNAAKLSWEIIESGDFPIPPDVSLWHHW